MKTTVTTLDAGSAGEIDLKDEIFGLEVRVRISSIAWCAISS